MAFDPDKYLQNASKKSSGFDPDAYLNQGSESPKKEEESTLSKVADGLGSVTDRLTSGFTLGLDKYVKAGARSGLKKIGNIFSSKDNQEDSSFSGNLEDVKKEQENDIGIGGSALEVAGALSNPVGAAARGVGILGRTAINAAEGAIQGGTESGVGGAAIGAATNLAGGAVGEAIGKSAQFVKKLMNSDVLSESVEKAGAKALGIDSARAQTKIKKDAIRFGVDPNQKVGELVETAKKLELIQPTLKGTKKKVDEVGKQAKQAIGELISVADNAIGDIPQGKDTITVLSKLQADLRDEVTGVSGKVLKSKAGANREITNSLSDIMDGKGNVNSVEFLHKARQDIGDTVSSLRRVNPDDVKIKQYNRVYNTLNGLIDSRMSTAGEEIHTAWKAANKAAHTTLAVSDSLTSAASKKMNQFNNVVSAGAAYGGASSLGIDPGLVASAVVGKNILANKFPGITYKALNSFQDMIRSDSGKALTSVPKYGAELYETYLKDGINGLAKKTTLLTVTDPEFRAGFSEE